MVLPESSDVGNPFESIHLRAFGVRGLSRHSSATADSSWFPRFSLIRQFLCSSCRAIASAAADVLFVAK
jgi:hypothetical protein